jgi:hypothetical protein
MQLVSDLWAQNTVYNLWRRSPRAAKWLLSEVANVLCARLDPITPHATASTRQRLGEVIALGETLNISALLDEPDLPPELAGLAETYSHEDWRDILALAGMARSDVERGLQCNSQLEHLRR